MCSPRRVRSCISRRNERRIVERSNPAKRIIEPKMKGTPLDHKRTRDRELYLSALITTPQCLPLDLNIDGDRRLGIDLSLLQGMSIPF